MCLGASLVSAVELLYYATFGFGLYLYDNNYFTVLKQNLKDLRQKWAIGFRNSLRDEHEFASNTIKTYQAKHPKHKENRW